MKKINFKKITALGASLLMTGMTAGFAAAATVDDAFTDGVAVVYGADLDMAAATSIKTMLADYVESTDSTSVEGGEAFNLFKDNDKLHFGDSTDSIITSAIDDNDMDVLSDGDYDSGSLDVGYEQTVTLGSKAMELITDSDLNDEDPTIGFHYDDDEVLTYTISFDDGVVIEGASGMPETDFPLFGESYYVLDADGTDGSEKLTLLNSASTAVISDGESITLGGKAVSIVYLIDSGASFMVDGETTDKIAEGESFELEDGSYLIYKTEIYEAVQGATNKAEITIGSGKVILEHGQDVDYMGDSIDGLSVTIDGDGTDLASLAIKWETDGEVFLTKGDTLDMPVFGKFSVLFNGLDFGTTTEDISVTNGDTLTLSMGNYDIDLMHNDTSTTYVGGDEAELVTITATESASQQFGIGKDQRFLATLLDSDLTDVETAYYEVQSLNNDTAEFDLSINDLIGTEDFDFTDATAGDDEDLTNAINLKVIGVFDSGDLVPAAYNVSAYWTPGYVNVTDSKALMDFAVLNVSAASTLHWDIVVSDEGMIVEIPASNSDTIDFYEADKDLDLDTAFAGTPLKLAVDYDSDDKLYAKYSAGVSMVDESTDKTVGYVADVHATKVMIDSDTHEAELEYYAEEVTADLKLVAGGEISSTTTLGAEVITAAEAAASTKKLVVVGGSCVNAAAATLLGGAYCGEAFTDATGVGANQFIVKGYEASAINGKLAVLVAGYEAADTTNAATFFTKSADMGEVTGEYVKGLEAVQDLA